MNRIFFALALGLLLSACDCSDDVTLEIVEPSNGQTFTSGDDVDADLDGVQIIVLVSTSGLDLGKTVTLKLNDEELTAEVGAGGDVRFEDEVTLNPGDNTLQATAGGESSGVITVTLGSGEECPALTISQPEDGQILRGSDDEDDEPCGEFVYTVVASTGAQEGREAELFVNSNSVGSTQVEGAQLRFAGITLDSGPNDLEVRLDGGDCLAEASITVDCGVTCSIRAPTGDTLNGESDTSGDPGMQVDVEVETDAEDGQDVTIVVDENEQGTQAAAGGSATFDDVALAEGERSMQAICRDSAGNEARSARVTFLVDSVDPEVDVTTNRTTYSVNDDLDDGTAGIQISLCGTSSEAGELCAAVSGGAAGPDGCEQVSEDEEGCGIVTCTGAVTLELSATDDAGNVGTDTLAVQCDDGLPQLQIIDPANGALLNAADDSAPGGSLQYDIIVCTSEVGQDVDLFRGDGNLLGTVAAVGAPCDSPAYGLLPGTATFDDVNLPEGETTLRAHTADSSDNPGDSPEITITVDSVPPILQLTVCDDVLGPPEDTDGNPDNGVQADFRGTTDVGGPDVTVTVESPDGGSQDYTDGPNAFGALDYVGVTFENGVSTVTASLTDAAGNITLIECTVTANSGGSVDITSPVAGTDFTHATDANSGVAGFQGAVVHVVSDGPTDGTMQVCVDASDGAGVVLSVCVDYDSAGGEDISVTLPEGVNASSDVTLTARTVGHPGGAITSPAVVVQVDTLRPATIIGGLSFTVIDHRAGIVDITFTAPEDPTGRSVVGYDVRHSLSPFASENDGTIINDTPVGGISLPGQSQTLRVQDLRPQTFHYLAVRAFDAVGNAADSVTGIVPIDLLVDVINSPTAVGGHRFGFTVAGGQDVDGDGFDDFVVGTNDLTGSMTAYLFYGGVGGATLGTEFDGGGAFESFGFAVAMLRDFNGDSFPDIAVSNYYAGAGPSGVVYIYFGGAALPATLTALDADVTINGAVGDYLGWTLASAGDINGDGFTDLLAGATPYPGLGDGKVYVVLGRGDASGYTLDLPADRDLEIDSSIADGGLGGAVGAAGDLNGDDFDDFVIGACRDGEIGEAYVFLGEDAPEDDPIRLASEGTTLTGAAGELGYGCSVGGVGDVTNDGQLDIVVGARRRDPNNRGSFYVYPGNGLGGVGAGLEFRNDLGPSPDSDQLGYVVAVTLGTENFAQPSLDAADNVADLAIASYRRSDGFGRVQLYWGGVGLTGGDVVNAPAFIDEPVGSSSLTGVAWVGDVDGDGFVDLVMGDESATVGVAADAGRAYLVH